MSKKIAIALSVFPGVLFVGILISYICCSIAERNLPKAGANIGLCILGLAFLVNIPTIIAWIIFLSGKQKKETT